jgi:hypothetical protein
LTKLRERRALATQKARTARSVLGSTSSSRALRAPQQQQSSYLYLRMRQRYEDGERRLLRETTQRIRQQQRVERERIAEHDRTYQTFKFKETLRRKVQKRQATILPTIPETYRNRFYQQAESEHEALRQRKLSKGRRKAYPTDSLAQYNSIVAEECRPTPSARLRQEMQRRVQRLRNPSPRKKYIRNSLG